MGYYTTYNLTTVPASSDEELNVMFKGVEYFDGGDVAVYLTDGESTKWYDHEADMLQVSRENPDVLFILDGAGEEAGDLWRKWFYRGKKLEWRPKTERPELTDVMGWEKLVYHDPVR